MITYAWPPPSQHLYKKTRKKVVLITQMHQNPLDLKTNVDFLMNYLSGASSQSIIWK